MITITPCFLAHHKRPDGTYPAKMRVTFRRKSRWIPTTVNARPDQLTRSLHPKDPLLIRRLDELRGQMLGAVAKLSPFALDAMDVDGVVAFIRHDLAAPSFRLDFLDFGRGLIDGMHGKTRETYATALGAFERVTGRTAVDVNEITAGMLRDFLERCQARKSAGQYLSRLSYIYAQARDRYNDEDAGLLLIPRNPFARVEAQRVIPEGARPLDHGTMQRIIDAAADDADRWALDVFIVSFALMGANVADLWAAVPPVEGVWRYNRAKTSGRRADKSEMRVPVPGEIAPVLGRLTEGAAPGRWLNLGKSTRATSVTCRANLGLRRWAERNGVDSFTMYSARKTFATEARRAGIEKATIDECLAHVGDYRLADIYIERQWGPIWEAQRRVLDRFKWG